MSRWLNKLQTRVRTFVQPAAVFVGGASVADAVAAFEAWAVEHAGSVCEIGLSSTWVHACVVPAEVVAASEGDEDAWLDYARLQFEHYFGASFGVSGSAWTLAASRDARAALVCAVPAELLSALRVVAALHHVHIRRVAPWWVRGAQAALREALLDETAPRAVAAVEPTRATLVVVQGGRIARVLSEPSIAPQDWRARLMNGLHVDTVPTSLWSFALGTDEEQAQALRGQVVPELVFQQIEAAA